MIVYSYSGVNASLIKSYRVSLPRCYRPVKKDLHARLEFAQIKSSGISHDRARKLFSIRANEIIKILITILVYLVIIEFYLGVLTSIKASRKER